MRFLALTVIGIGFGLTVGLPPFLLVLALRSELPDVAWLLLAYPVLLVVTALAGRMTFGRQHHGPAMWWIWHHH